MQIVVRTEQLNDLSVLRDLGVDAIKSITSKLSSLDPTPVHPSDLQQALEEILPGQKNEVTVITRLLMQLYTVRRQEGLSVDELLQGITKGLATSKGWKDEELARWQSLERYLTPLFSLSTVWTVVKAVDLSYDYAYLLQNAKVITDIRPVFNEDASKIQGAVITHTLRFYYESAEGNKSMSIALENEELEKLFKACDRALRKAKTAKNFMQTHDVKSAFICGEEK